MQEKYHLGRVIGAGSFGVVRECVEKTSGRVNAVKTIPKVPKRGLPTPRYLLKLRTEVTDRKAASAGHGAPVAICGHQIVNSQLVQLVQAARPGHLPYPEKQHHTGSGYQGFW
jgi:hypothetical protein